MKDYERRYIQADGLKVSTREDGPVKISGYAARFNKYSEDFGGFREKIKPGAFTHALKNSDVRALFNHDPNHVLARTKSGTLELKEDDKGLWMEATLPDTQFARDLAKSIDRGDISQQSFGFTLSEGGVSWKKHAEHGEVRTIEKVDQLFDVSPVTYPAFPDTDIAQRSRAAWHTRQEDTSSGMVVDVELPPTAKELREIVTELKSIIPELMGEKIKALLDSPTTTEAEPTPDSPTTTEETLDRTSLLLAKADQILKKDL